MEMIEGGRVLSRDKNGKNTAASLRGRKVMITQKNNHKDKCGCMIKKKNLNVLWRVPCHFLWKQRFRASLTVETALVLPIFMFMMLSIISYCRIIEYSDTVAESLHQSSRLMAQYAYASKEGGAAGALGSGLGGVAISVAYASNQVNSNLSSKGFNDGSISYLRSVAMKNDVIDLIATEEIPILYDFLGVKQIRVMDRARVRAFTGYDNTGLEDMNTEETIVYVTASGSVYHRSRNCSHLNVTPTAVNAGQLSGARSSQGAKYYQCEYCAKKKECSVYYITEYGNRYHTTATCQALKRDVTAVPLSRVGGKSACKSCGG